MKYLASIAMFYIGMYGTLHIWASATTYDAEVYLSADDCIVPKNWEAKEPCVIDHVQLRLHPYIATADALSLEKNGTLFVFPNASKINSFRIYDWHYDIGREILAAGVGALFLLWSLALTFETDLIKSVIRKRQAA